MARIDSVDAQILMALDANSEATILALSQTLGLARNTVHSRLRRLHDDGTLLAVSRRLDPSSLGYGLVAFASLSVSQTNAAAALEGLRQMPEVVEAHSTTGDADLLVKVVARDPADLHRITSELLAIEGVERTSTMLSLLEVSPTNYTPLLERIASEGQRQQGRSRRRDNA